MILQFGLEIEEKVYPAFIQESDGIDLTCGTRGLLYFLEQHLGIYYPENTEYLRYEQYRQVLLQYLQKNEEAFFRTSFEADSVATAIALLERRDELLLANWDFSIEENMPTRLRNMAEIEAMVQFQHALHDGFAERFNKVIYWLERIEIDIEKIILNEPLRLLPPYLQRLMQTLQQKGIQIKEQTFEIAAKDSDLQNLQKALLKQPFEKKRILADGSLIILKARRETYAAEYIAKLMHHNKDYHPVCLIPNKNRALDNCMVEEGLPSFGILSASLARPTLQILRLVGTFLWKPINAYKILEFVSLPNVPLHKKLARKIAKVMSEKPGLNSLTWRKMVADFFNEFEHRIAENPTKKKEIEKEEKEARAQFNKWFRRKRYDINSAAPKSDVKDLYEGVFIWADNQLNETKKELDNIQKRIDTPSTPHTETENLLHTKETLTKQLNALQGLWEQSKRLTDILESLPESDTHISFLRLERLVRTINEPAAMRFRRTEAGHLPYVHHSSAIVRPTSHILWWNFTDSEANTGFAKWYPSESTYLANIDVTLESPSQENNRKLWQRIQAVLKCQQQLILVLPQYVDGKEQLPHPLWGDICATLGEDDLDKITVSVDEEENLSFLEQFYTLPSPYSLNPTTRPKTKPILHIPTEHPISKRDRESFTSLSNLIYYPYQWFFRYKTEFSRSEILSISKEHRLKGNLAHSVFENLLNEIKKSEKKWTKDEVEVWVNEFTPKLLELEGAILLQYGFEPERIGFLETMRNATWALVNSIQSNNWQIVATEMRVEGQMLGQPLYGFVDVVLQRGEEKAIIDLKWSGATRRLSSFTNNLDLQLVIYSKLVTESTDWAHTAYFIISESRLLARNTLAFEEAVTAPPTDMHFKEIHKQIWQIMARTFDWRKRQVMAGEIEIRTEQTAQELEQIYIDNELHAKELMHLLELPKENAPYDDYSVLINQVN